MSFEGKTWGSLSKLEQDELWNGLAYCEENFKKTGDTNCIIYFENNLKVDGYITQYSEFNNPPKVDISIEIDNNSIITKQ